MPSSASLVVLPESVLATIPGLDYQSGPNSDAGNLEVLMKSSTNPQAVSALFSGALVRTISYRGQPVGGVEVLRTRTTLPPDQSSAVVRRLLEDFATVPPSSTTLQGQPIWQVDHARGQNVGAVAWIRGTDLILIWSDGIRDARMVAAEYLKAAS